MSEATYATVASFAMDVARAAENRVTLHELIVPGVRRHPGVVSGHWMMDREADESVVVVTFTSLDAAQAFVQNVTNNAANQAAAGMKLIRIRLVEVEASFLHP
jgi:quinol monooxygenase YgiN